MQNPRELFTDPYHRTPDLGGVLSTEEMGDLVAA